MGLNNEMNMNHDKEVGMQQGWPRSVAVVIGLLLALVTVGAGWAQPQAPSAPPQQGQQSGPGMMGPGRMMGPTMPMMGDMNQMVQACMQMMNQMMGQTPGSSGSSQPGAPAPKSRTN